MFRQTKLSLTVIVRYLKKNKCSHLYRENIASGSFKVYMSNRPQIDKKLIAVFDVGFIKGGL